MSRTSRSFRIAATASLPSQPWGCSPLRAAATTAWPTPRPNGKPVTIDYWSWTLGAKATVEAFNRTHKDIQVKFTEIRARPRATANWPTR